MINRYYPDPLTALQRRLEHHNLSEVARAAQCSYTTAWRLARGLADDVQVQTVTRLHDAMDDIDDAKRGAGDATS
jgi:hypothetical protein